MRSRQSFWRKLYINLSSEVLKIDCYEEKGRVDADDESLPSTSFKFSLSRASDGDTRTSTERHPIGLADIIMADTVSDLDDSDIEDFVFSIHM